MSAERIADGFFVEVGFHGSNNSALQVGRRLVLFDAPQLPSDAQRWRQEVEALGRVDYLVNTDHHPDHTVGNRWLPGAVVAHGRTRERLARPEVSTDYLRELFGVIGPDSVADLDGYAPRLPEITFESDLTLWVDDTRVELMHAPGHTENTVMAWLPDARILVAGDNVCEASLPAFQDSSVTGLFDALDLAESLPFEQLVPGHGEVVGREGLGRYRDQLRSWSPPSPRPWTPAARGRSAPPPSATRTASTATSRPAPTIRRSWSRPSSVPRSRPSSTRSPPNRTFADAERAACLSVE